MRPHVHAAVVAALLVATALATPPALAGPAAPAVADVAVTATDQLNVGESLAVGEELLSPNGRWALVMTEGGLHVYEISPYAFPGARGVTRGPVLTSPRGFAGFDRATLRADGNLVLSERGIARVSTGTAGSGAVRLNVLDNGNVAMRDSAGRLVTHFGLHRVRFLNPGARLLPGDTHYGDAGRTTLTMQPDGNLVLRQDGRARWSTGTKAYPGAFAVMQRDGNFVVRDANGVARWSTGTGPDLGVAVWLQNGAAYVGTDGLSLESFTQTSYDELRPGARLAPAQGLRSYWDDCRLQMQLNGNLVLRCNGSVRWVSGTFFPRSTVTMQRDGNLVIRDATGRARWSTGTRGDGVRLRLYGIRPVFDANGPYFGPTLAVVGDRGFLWSP
jgi:hypothetical protein